MFNSKRIIRFLSGFTSVSLIIALAMIVLAILTEILAHKGNLTTRGFWPSVAINLVPLIVVGGITLWLPARFLKAVYHLENAQAGIDSLIRSRFGLMGFEPWMKIGQGKILLNADSVLTRVGGPGTLIINNDSAVVLERGGKLTKVQGPGFPTLDAFEKIYDIVNMQPRRWVYTVNAMTKEGISIQWDADVRYQIADGNQHTNKELPYPFSPKDVFAAATSAWRRERGQIQDMDWEGRVIVSQTEGILRSILARRKLDQLIGMTEAEEQTAREAVQRELERDLGKAVSDFGAKILQVTLDNLKVEDSITQEWIKAWKTRWQKEATCRLAQEEAERIRNYESVKAMAQSMLIRRIASELRGLDVTQPVTPSLILMRLFSVLDRASLAGTSRIFVPNQALDGLERIRQLVGISDLGTAGLFGPPTSEKTSVAMNEQLNEMKARIAKLEEQLERASRPEQKDQADEHASGTASIIPLALPTRLIWPPPDSLRHTLASSVPSGPEYTEVSQLSINGKAYDVHRVPSATGHGEALHPLHDRNYLPIQVSKRDKPEPVDAYVVVRRVNQPGQDEQQVESSEIPNAQAWVELIHGDLVVRVMGGVLGAESDRQFLVATLPPRIIGVVEAILTPAVPESAPSAA